MMSIEIKFKKYSLVQGSFNAININVSCGRQPYESMITNPKPNYIFSNFNNY